MAIEIVAEGRLYLEAYSCALKGFSTLRMSGLVYKCLETVDGRVWLTTKQGGFLMRKWRGKWIVDDLLRVSCILKLARRKV